jgi:hypothetical protein
MNKFADKNQHFVIFEINGKLQEKVYSCESTLLHSDDNYSVYKKIITNDKNPISMFVTYNGYFIRGHIYYDQTEYCIKKYSQYVSLQIGNWCYDNIAICSLDDFVYF